MSASRRARWMAGAALAWAVSARADSAADEILRVINEERAALDRPPLSLSPELSMLAAELVAEIDVGGRLDFEPISGTELLDRARAHGYGGLAVQQLTAVDNEPGCEIVEGWSARLVGSDGYRRPEVREIGVAAGFVQDLPLTVAVVGVPRSADRTRKRWPGVAPTESLTADLFRLLNERRFRLGRPLFVRSDELDSRAQSFADAILQDPYKDGDGVVTLPGVAVLYCKARGSYVETPDFSIDRWLRSERQVFVGVGKSSAGVGLASRGREGRLEAVWVLIVEEGALAKQ